MSGTAQKVVKTCRIAKHCHETDDHFDFFLNLYTFSGHMDYLEKVYAAKLNPKAIEASRKRRFKRNNQVDIESKF